MKQKSIRLSHMETSYVYVSTFDPIQALIYQVTVDSLLPLGQTWKLIPKEVKGMFTYDEIENKLHENLKKRQKNLGMRTCSKVNNDKRGEFLFQETGIR
jgi:hypothetical protein